MNKIQPAGECPGCGHPETTCRYNHFQQDDLEIHAWEHKCPNCGQRQTTGYRSDDEDGFGVENPAICPYCGRPGAPTAS